MGESKHDGLAVPGRVVLAHEPPFTLGRLKVDPATRQVAANGRSETLEPRVMQALVALARANGGIVTRDELIERCWSGRIVTDDAINRVLSRIRHVADGIGSGSFRLETITKVGYRLVQDGAAAQAVPAEHEPSPVGGEAERLPRRTLLLSAGAVGLAAAAWSLWPSEADRRQPLPEAAALYAKGLDARDGMLPGGRAQAEAYFRQAVEVDPSFADAWGALAMHLAVGLRHADVDSLQALADRSRAAAAEALELDPGQADAKAALAIVPSTFRNWGKSERAIRSVLREHPNHPMLTNTLAMLLGDTAQWDRAVEAARRAVALRPFAPPAATTLLYALWSASRLIEADRVSAQSLERWPRVPPVWFAHLEFLAYSGRPQEAMRFTQDEDRWPALIEPLKGAPFAEVKALVTRDRRDIELARSLLLDEVAANIHFAHPAARFFATVGAIDEAFEVLEAYLLRRGRFAAKAPPLHPLTRVETYCLFDPPAHNLWPHSRFHRLTREVGLNAYWDSIGFTPPHLQR